MLRMASACRSVRLNSAIITGLGLILCADDLDHAIEVEIGDQIAFEQFHPVIDLAQPVRGAADEHFNLVRGPLGENVFQPQHARGAVCTQAR
jgi:hypothetical protein